MAAAAASAITEGGLPPLRFRGCAYFRLRVVLATLSGRRIRIDGIREKDEEPGVKDFEASFLRLIEKITNGCRIEINETGTCLRYAPGRLIGGAFSHECPTSRGVGYFLEPLLMLAPFCKKPVRAVLTGVTNSPVDFSVDTFRNVTLPTVQHFGVTEGLSLVIKRRGAAPKGGGMVIFSCPVVRELRPIHITMEGYVKRVRGIAFVTKLSPQIGNRAVESARGLLNKLLPDVYIATDHYKGLESGDSPGYGLQLQAETTAGCVYSAEATAEPGETPEDLGARVSRFLCDEIARGGCVDSGTTPLVLLFMALSPEDVSQVRTGPLSPVAIEMLRLLRDFFGVLFKLKAEPKGTIRRASSAHRLLVEADPALKARREAEERRAKKRRAMGDGDDRDDGRDLTRSRGGGAGDDDDEDDDEDDDDEDGDEDEADGGAGGGGVTVDRSKGGRKRSRKDRPSGGRAGLQQLAAQAAAGAAGGGGGGSTTAKAADELLEVAETDTVLVTCQGIGFKNFAKKVT